MQYILTEQEYRALTVGKSCLPDNIISFNKGVVKVPSVANEPTACVVINYSNGTSVFLDERTINTILKTIKEKLP